MTNTSESNLQLFSYENKEIRTVTINGEPWWVLSDVCKVLELSDTSKTAERLDNDEKGTNQIRTLGGLQNFIIINESGLYSVIIRSDKPEAKKFRKWITSEVLPQIRRTGNYSVPTSTASIETESPNLEQLLSPKTASRILGISEKTLCKWKARGKGPKVTFVGKLTRYSRSAIQEFIRSSNCGCCFGPVSMASSETRPSYNVADLATEVIDRFEKTLSDYAKQDAQDGQYVLEKIFSHRLITSEGWVTVEEVIRLLTREHIAGSADPAKRFACEKMLKDIGIRLELDSSNHWTIWISNTLGALARILADSPWPKGWGRALKKIPGALHKDLMRFTGSPTAAIGIPLKQTSICTGALVPVNPSGQKLKDLVAPDQVDVLSRIYKMSGSMHMTNTQLVCIVLHAISNAHLLGDCR